MWSLGQEVGSVTSLPVALIMFPLGGHRPVPGNCVIPAAHSKGKQLSDGAPVAKQSSMVIYG